MATVGTATCPDTGKLVLVIRFDDVAELHSVRTLCRNNDEEDVESYQHLVNVGHWSADSERSVAAIEEVMSKVLIALLPKI